MLVLLPEFIKKEDDQLHVQTNSLYRQAKQFSIPQNSHIALDWLNGLNLKLLQDQKRKKKKKTHSIAKTVLLDDRTNY